MAKKAKTKKTTAAKKSKTAKKTTAKPKASAKKTAAKKTTVKKSTPKKATKTSSAKKTVAKKAPAKKASKKTTKKVEKPKASRGEKAAMRKASKKDAAEKAKAFKVKRERHSMEAAEDYSELVSDLIENYGEARICNIAENLGVSHVTALRTVRRLEKEGFLSTDPHKPVELTTKGKKTAKAAKERNNLVTTFLVKLGIPEKTAKIDAKGIEHHMSAATVKAFKSYVK